MDVDGNLISVKFSGISGLVEFSRFLRQKVDISGNLRLIDPSGFPRFQFRARVARYKTSLYIIRGSK